MPNKPSIDRSSSIMGQWIPYPEADISYLFLSISEALFNFFEIYAN